MVLDYFKRISEIPRGSYNCEAISNYLVNFAKEHNLKYYQDKAYNVVIYKPASHGYENCPPLIMQGHMDMVCEKVSENSHDFMKDPIKVIVDGNFIHADKTTLGADDGIAVAYMLDILADDKLICPPLEMLITSDEEVGMLGAKAFDITKLCGRNMINLDSEEEGIFVAACAGGITGFFSWDIERIQAYGIKCNIVIKGLKGGHSGTEIDKHRTNAVMLAGRIAGDLAEVPYQLISINGGNKDNVIPNEAKIELVVSGDNIDELKGVLDKSRINILNELSTSEPNLLIQLEVPSAKEEGCEALDEGTKNMLLSFFNVIPNGVHVMSADIEGMVESSSNLGIIRTEEEKITVCVSARSQKESYKNYIVKRLFGIAQIFGAEFKTEGEYPGWDIKPESEFRDLLCSVFEKKYGKKAVVASIHAGLEGGVLSAKEPGMDIVSIGPDALDVHTVNERMDINSVNRVYDFLRSFIEEYAHKYADGQ